MAALYECPSQILRTVSSSNIFVTFEPGEIAKSNEQSLQSSSTDFSDKHGDEQRKTATTWGTQPQLLMSRRSEHSNHSTLLLLFKSCLLFRNVSDPFLIHDTN